MPPCSSCRARWTAWQNCAESTENGGGDLGAAAGVPADRAGLRFEAQPDAAGDAMARAGTADLLRAVPDALDPDTGESRSIQGAGCRRRRRAFALGAGDVAVMPGAAPNLRPLEHRWPRLHLDLSGRDALADLCGARRLRQSL